MTTFPVSLAAGALLSLGIAATASSMPGAGADTPTLDADAQAFIAHATADNAMQIALAQVVLARSSSTPARALAQRLLDDHNALNEKFTDISVARKAHGQAHGVSDEAVAADRLRLQSLRGAALDQAFADMMVREHRRVIPIYERAANTADPGLRKLARDSLPMLRAHLQAALALGGGRS